MRRARGLLGMVPPLLVGAAVAGAAEMSAGLLLYSTEGFLPALTLILTVETGALAVGLWSGSLQLGEGVVEQVRRRWLFALVTFAVAAAFSTGMTFLDELLTGGIGQGLGLAFLGSLPLFALGSLLGAMARSEGVVAPAATTVGFPAVVGLAVGFLLTGGVLLPNMAPYTLYLVCLTALSGGALLQGWVLDARPTERLLDFQWTARGELKAAEWLRGSEATVRRVLLENGRMRGAEDLAGAPGREWERAVLAALRGAGKYPGAVLYVGGGSGTLARFLLGDFPEGRIVIIEGSSELVLMARKHLHAFLGWGGVQLHIGDPWALVEEMAGGFPLVLIDGGVLPVHGRLPWVPPGGWRDLERLAGPSGSVVLGGIGRGSGEGGAPLEAFMDMASAAFPRVAYYEGGEEGFFLMSGPEAPFWSPALPGFHVTALKEG